uniref:RNA-dependent RNA polymerase n=1 Tax=Nippostrongylus brasiliensis TaxID=27835 RepID=A0A0N4YPF8_NIPBR
LFQKEGCSIFDEKLKKLFSLCEHLTDDKWKFPEKTKCPIRDEYRMLYCVSSLCEKVRILLATQITSALRLRDIRSQSLEQLKALCRRLEDSIARDSSAEKYFSFDDVAQRNALEVMGIRYEELCDDIFAMDEGFDSLLENNDVFMEGVEGVPSISMSSELANYAELCMQSMLTEVGLRYVDKAHKWFSEFPPRITHILKLGGRVLATVRCAKTLTGPWYTAVGHRRRSPLLSVAAYFPVGDG